jgi:hypothetical protein
MNQVEEMWGRIFMINRGREGLSGHLPEAKPKYRGSTNFLASDDASGPVAGVEERRARKNYVELVPDGTSTSGQVLKELVGRGFSINHIENATPSLNEIFMKMVGENHEEDAASFQAQIPTDRKASRLRNPDPLTAGDVSIGLRGLSRPIKCPEASCKGDQNRVRRPTRWPDPIHNPGDHCADPQ